MMNQIPRSDILLSVREKLERQKRFKKEHSALYASIELGKSLEMSMNSATSMVRSPYVMSEAAKNISAYINCIYALGTPMPKGIDQ